MGITEKREGVTRKSQEEERENRTKGGRGVGVHTATTGAVSTPGIETTPLTASVLARPSAESSHPTHAGRSDWALCK